MILKMLYKKWNTFNITSDFNVLWNGSSKPFEINLTWTTMASSASCLWKNEDSMNYRRLETHSVARATKPNHIMEWNLKLTGKWLSQSIFLNAIFFYYFWWGRAWLVTKGEEMHWKQNPENNMITTFYFWKTFFLNLFWKIHEI